MGVDIVLCGYKNDGRPVHTCWKVCVERIISRCKDSGRCNDSGLQLG